MSVEKINTVLYKCKCEAVSRAGVPCGFEWESATIPKRCRKCLRWTWNKPSKLITFNGKSMRLSQWSKELGISKDTLRSRFGKGWPIEDCLDPAHFQPGRKPKDEVA